MKNNTDWKWQMQNKINNIEQLKNAVGLTKHETQKLSEVTKVFPVQTTPYYASLAKKYDRNDPIRTQIIPDIRELKEITKKKINEGWDNPEDFIDLEHTVEQKYPNRVAWLITNICPSWCRHCVRKIMNDTSLVQSFSKKKLESAIKIIKEKEYINDVLITGGDAFMINTETINEILNRLLKIKHVHTIRFGTRTIVTLPQRITSDLKLVKILKKHMLSAVEQNKDIIINTQFNHPNEITKESMAALKLLRQTGCRLQNQTVLLKGINDKIEILEKLFHEIFRLGVRPYYLYQGIPTPGTNFRYTTISKGLNLMEQLYKRQKVSGHEKPIYILADKKYGKILLPPPGVKFKITQKKNKEGLKYERFQFPWKDGGIDYKIYY